MGSPYEILQDVDNDSDAEEMNGSKGKQKGSRWRHGEGKQKEEMGSREQLEAARHKFPEYTN